MGLEVSCVYTLNSGDTVSYASRRTGHEKQNYVITWTFQVGRSGQSVTAPYYYCHPNINISQGSVYTWIQPSANAVA